MAKSQSPRRLAWQAVFLPLRALQPTYTRLVSGSFYQPQVASVKSSDVT